MDHEFASEILHHRVLPSGTGGTCTHNGNSLCSPAEENKSGLCTLSSSDLRARFNTTASSNNNIEAGVSHKRGWKVQGQIAGEWRDRLGRHRRARPSENANTNVIDVSRISSIASSSCAGSEVSFEGLVDELRERLPRASLLEGLVAAQRHSGCHVYPGVEAVLPGTITGSLDEQHEDPLRRNKQGGASGRVCGNPRRPAPPVTAGTAGRRNWSSSSPEQHREVEAKGLMPPGCLKLRHPMTGPMRAHANSQPLLSRQNSQRPDSAAGTGPQPSLVLPPGGVFFSDGSAFRLVATEAADSENASPSAAMVAAAKAQERALPLLQVCAIKVAESKSS